MLEKKTQTKDCGKTYDKMKDSWFKSKGEGYFLWNCKKNAWVSIPIATARENKLIKII